MKKTLSIILALLLVLACPAAAFAAGVSDSDGALETVSQAVQSRGEELTLTLKVMAQGMIGIFIVMILIMLITVILNKATAPKTVRKTKEDK